MWTAFAFAAGVGLGWVGASFWRASVHDAASGTDAIRPERGGAAATLNVTDAPRAPSIPAPALADIVDYVRATPAMALTPALSQAWTPAAGVDRRWRHVVVHHTATRGGRVETFDRHHREKMKMKNGIAYHFLIGDGRGLGDGVVHVTPRWLRQLDGGHVKGADANRTAIGVCLVGDFTKEGPTRAQVAALKGLLNYLTAQLPLTDADILGHGDYPNQKTLCPGPLFPLADLLATRGAAPPDVPADPGPTR